MLIINRYECPSRGKVTLQAHKISPQYKLLKTYNVMSEQDIEKHFKGLKAIVNSVSKAYLLGKIDIVNIN